MALHINIFVVAVAAAVAAEFTVTAASSQRTAEGTVGRGEPETRTKRKAGGWCGELHLASYNKGLTGWQIGCVKGERAPSALPENHTLLQGIMITRIYYTHSIGSRDQYYFYTWPLNPVNKSE